MSNVSSELLCSKNFPQLVILPPHYNLVYNTPNKSECMGLSRGTDADSHECNEQSKGWVQGLEPATKSTELLHLSKLACWLAVIILREQEKIAQSLWQMCAVHVAGTRNRNIDGNFDDLSYPTQTTQEVNLLRETKIFLKQSFSIPYLLRYYIKTVLQKNCIFSTRLLDIFNDKNLKRLKKSR